MLHPPAGNEVDNPGPSVQAGEAEEEPEGAPDGCHDGPEVVQDNLAGVLLRRLAEVQDQGGHCDGWWTAVAAFIIVGHQGVVVSWSHGDGHVAQ